MARKLIGGRRHGDAMSLRERVAEIIGGVVGGRSLGAVLDPVCSEEVAAALAEGRAVVALESTIFSHLGLPSPANREALERCTCGASVRGVPSPRSPRCSTVWSALGLTDAEHERILGPARKAAERDIAVAVGQRWDLGATTVSASVAIAAAAGVKVFATGGIGGVHRGSEITGDISADLDAIASHPVITVSAGAKAFLDLPRTLEFLEAAGVPVLGWQHDWFPAFYTRSSGSADTAPGRVRRRGRPRSTPLAAAHRRGCS